MIIKILTFNVGLLDYKFFDMILFSNPCYTSYRIHHIPISLLSIDSDIIVIQECYDEDHFKFIYEKIKHVFPYFARKDKKRNIFQLHNGLAVFSKFPIKNINLLPYTTTDFIEQCFGNKSLLTVELEIENKKIVLFNIHLTAGCFDSQSINSSNVRLIQINEILAMVKYYQEKNYIVLLAGDFNSGPQHSNECYNYLITKDFIDSYLFSQKKYENQPKYTWSSENIVPNYHKNDNGRIDHLFFHKKDNIDVLETLILFDKPFINVINGKNQLYTCALSDHNGLLTILKI